VASLAALIGLAGVLGLDFVMVVFFEVELLIKDFLVTAMFVSPGFELNFVTPLYSASRVPNCKSDPNIPPKSLKYAV
jgi:hypothetical protein